jgi:hypothetical protein
VGLRNERFDQIVHGVLYSGIALFRHPGRRSRLLGSGCLHRAVDKQAGAIRAFDLPIAPEIEKDPRMAERPTTAIAGSDSLINVDGFEGPHRRPENGAGAGHARLTI